MNVFRRVERAYEAIFGRDNNPAEQKLEVSLTRSEPVKKRRRGCRGGCRNRLRKEAMAAKAAAIQKAKEKNDRRESNRIQQKGWTTDMPAPTGFARQLLAHWSGLPVQQIVPTPAMKEECGRVAGEIGFSLRYDESYDEFDVVTWPEKHKVIEKETRLRSHARRGADILKERRRSFSSSCPTE